MNGPVINHEFRMVSCLEHLAKAKDSAGGGNGDQVNHFGAESVLGMANCFPGDFSELVEIGRMTNAFGIRIPGPNSNPWRAGVPD